MCTVSRILLMTSSETSTLWSMQDPNPQKQCAACPALFPLALRHVTEPRALCFDVGRILSEITAAHFPSAVRHPTSRQTATIIQNRGNPFS